MRARHGYERDASLPVAEEANVILGEVETMARIPSYVAVRFWVSCETKSGESISVIGSDPALGKWDLALAKPLSASGRHFPHWVSDLVLLESTPEGTGGREVQFKFAILRPASADDDDGVHFEEFNRTLVIPAGAAGMLLEPPKPLVFGVLGAESELKLGEHPFGLDVESERVCRRSPSMMAAAAASDDGLYRVPSLLHAVASNFTAFTSANDINSNEDALADASAQFDRQVSDIDGLLSGCDMPMARQESVFTAIADGTLSPRKGSSGFRRSAARFCFARFWVSCATNSGDTVFVVGDGQALGNWNLQLGVPLRTSARHYPHWVSEDVLLEVPPSGTQSRSLKYEILVVSDSSTAQPRREELGHTRFFTIENSDSGRLLEPSFPSHFGVAEDETSSLTARFAGSDSLLDVMLTEVRPLGRSASAAELEDFENSSGFARKRSVAAGDSMLDLAAAGQQSDDPVYCP